MFKLFRKKLNKKGFTLAEMLIVVAIIAILVAIAVPIFASALRKAQWRTNEANVRSVKSAAVTKILAKWDENDDNGGETLSEGAKEDWGWKATAQVDAHGDISNLQVYVVANIASANVTTGVGLSATSIKDITNEEESGTIAPKASGGYYVQVAITDIDLD